jgi:hypothetical protein
MTAFTASRDLRDWTTALARQSEPPTLVLNEPSCYHFRAFDPRLPLRGFSRRSSIPPGSGPTTRNGLSELIRTIPHYSVARLSAEREGTFRGFEPRLPL